MLRWALASFAVAAVAAVLGFRRVGGEAIWVGEVFLAGFVGLAVASSVKGRRRRRV